MLYVPGFTYTNLTKSLTDDADTCDMHLESLHPMGRLRRANGDRVRGVISGFR